MIGYTVRSTGDGISQTLTYQEMISDLPQPYGFCEYCYKVGNFKAVGNHKVYTVRHLGKAVVRTYNGKNTRHKCDVCGQELYYSRQYRPIEMTEKEKKRSKLK